MPYDKKVETIENAKGFIAYLLKNQDENIVNYRAQIYDTGNLIARNLSDEDKKRMQEISNYSIDDPYNIDTPQDLSLDVYTLDFLAQLCRENEKMIDDAQAYLSLNSIRPASAGADPKQQQCWTNRLSKLEKWANETQTLTSICNLSTPFAF